MISGSRTPEEALASYHAFSASHALHYRWLLRLQRLIPRVPPRLLGASLRAIDQRRFIHWAFDHYLNVAHPDFVARRAGPARPALTATLRA